MLNLRTRTPKAPKTKRFWTEEENALFEEALRRYGPRNPAKVKSFMDTFADPDTIRSFTVTQIRTHEQKWTIRQQKKQASLPPESSAVQTPETPFECDFVPQEILRDDWLPSFEIPIEEFSFCPVEEPSELMKILHCPEELTDKENKSSPLHCSESLDDLFAITPRSFWDAPLDFNY